MTTVQYHRLSYCIKYQNWNVKPIFSVQVRNTIVLDIKTSVKIGQTWQPQYY